MLQKFKNHLSNPITWGGYYKLCGIALLGSMAVSMGIYLKAKHDMKKLEKEYYDFEEDEAE